MGNDTWEKKRKEETRIAGEIIELLRKENKTLSEAEVILSYVENRIRDQKNQYAKTTKIDKKYSLPTLEGCKESHIGILS